MDGSSPPRGDDDQPGALLVGDGVEPLGSLAAGQAQADLLARDVGGAAHPVEQPQGVTLLVLEDQLEAERGEPGRRRRRRSRVGGQDVSETHGGLQGGREHARVASGDDRAVRPVDPAQHRALEPASPRALVFVRGGHDTDRAPRASGNLDRDAAQHRPRERSPPAGAHHEQACALLVGCLDQPGGDRTVVQAGANLDAVGRRRADGAQQLVSAGAGAGRGVSADVHQDQACAEAHRQRTRDPGGRRGAGRVVDCAQHWPWIVVLGHRGQWWPRIMVAAMGAST